MKLLLSTTLVAAATAIGCGGAVESSAAADETHALATCDPTGGIQTIGEVPGYVSALHGAGSNVYAVAFTPDDAGFYSATSGALFRLGPNGAQELTDDSLDPNALANVGSTLAFLEFTPSGQTPHSGAAAGTIDASGSIATLAQLNNVAFTSLTSSANGFAWLSTDWTKQPNSAAIMTSGGSLPAYAIPAGVVVTSNIVTDGARTYGAFSTNGAASVVGVISGGAPSLYVLDPSPADTVTMVGVDEQNLYYVSSSGGSSAATLWSIPTAGTTPPTSLASLPDGTNVVIAKGNAYWFEPQPQQSNVMTVPLELIDVGDAEQPLQAASQSAATTQPIMAIGTDDCGVLLAVASSLGNSTILRMALQ